MFVSRYSKQNELHEHWSSNHVYLRCVKHGLFFVFLKVALWNHIKLKGTPGKERAANDSDYSTYEVMLRYHRVKDTTDISYHLL